MRPPLETSPSPRKPPPTPPKEGRPSLHQISLHAVRPPLPSGGAGGGFEAP